jgi:hypothetical protein
MSLRSPTEDEKAAFVMPAWIAGIQVCMDASGDVHVDLDSSPPCWNDGIGGLFFNRAKLIYSFLKGDHEGHEERIFPQRRKDAKSNINSKLETCPELSRRIRNSKQI